jgi:homoserine dehydrogenase
LHPAIEGILCRPYIPPVSGSKTGICLLGCGVVGSGVVKILAEQAELLHRRTGLRFEIRHVVVRDAKKHRARDASLPIADDPIKAIEDPKTQIVVELMGGTARAAELVEHALRLGKHVVTANKTLLAQRGPELFALARKHHACIAFEASCGGGIPIIDALSRGLIANRIDAMVGIVNGTCNVILTRMTRNGWSYAQALEEAQKLGFAEADPTMDVSGRDAAQKLALLAGLAFNVRVAESDISIEGISTLQPIDIQFADELGYVIKLLAIAERSGDGKLALRVHPTLVHKADVLAEVSGSFNAISVYGHALGHALFYGRGAGQMPTASAVVADLVGVAMGVTPLAFEKLHIYPDSSAPLNMKYAIIIPDGAADEPLKELNGKTPIEAAHTPNMDRIAMEGRQGTARTVPEGFESGSDVATMCAAGLRPGNVYHTGRAPLEAAAQNIPLAPDRLGLPLQSGHRRRRDHERSLRRRDFQRRGAGS